jgi:type I restriction enzyme S subunit
MKMAAKTTFRQIEGKMIPEDWEVLELRQISKVIDSLHVTPDYSSDGIPMVRATDIKRGNLRLERTLRVTKEIYEEFTRNHKPRRNDIVMSRVGTYFVTSFVETDEQFCLGQNTVVICPSIDSRFVYYALNSRFVTRQIEEELVGSGGQETISLEDIRALLIPKPTDRREIEGISRILSDLDSKIELNDQINKTLEAIGQAIFKHWLIDFEFPNAEGKPYKSSGGAMVYNEELGKDIPKEWTVKNLNEISDNFDSKRVPLSNREREARRGSYPYYGAAGVLDHVNDFIFDGTYVLMGEDGSVTDEAGYPVLQYVWGRFWVNNHAHILQGRGISNELLYLYLKHTTVSHIVTGAVQPKINQGNMNRLKFCLPKPDIMLKLETTLFSLFGKVKINSDEINTLSLIRDSLLPKLMSGKIRVSVEVR